MIYVFPLFSQDTASYKWLLTIYEKRSTVKKNLFWKILLKCMSAEHESNLKCMSLLTWHAGITPLILNIYSASTISLPSFLFFPSCSCKMLRINLDLVMFKCHYLCFYANYLLSSSLTSCFFHLLSVASGVSKSSC